MRGRNTKDNSALFMEKAVELSLAPKAGDVIIQTKASFV